MMSKNDRPKHRVIRELTLDEQQKLELLEDKLQDLKDSVEQKRSIFDEKRGESGQHQRNDRDLGFDRHDRVKCI